MRKPRVTISFNGQELEVLLASTSVNKSLSMGYLHNKLLHAYKQIRVKHERS